MITAQCASFHLIHTNWPLMCARLLTGVQLRLCHRANSGSRLWAPDRHQPQQQTRVCQTLRQTYINLLLFIQQATSGQQNTSYIIAL